jgi:hypothetical protein
VQRLTLAHFVLIPRYRFQSSIDARKSKGNRLCWESVARERASVALD